MFEGLGRVIKWARENCPECSFSVTEQKDRPTIISIKGRDDNQIRTVVYARQSKVRAGVRLLMFI